MHTSTTNYHPHQHYHYYHHIYHGRHIRFHQSFVGPAAQTQWSMTKSRNQLELDLDMPVVFNLRHLARNLGSASRTRSGAGVSENWLIKSPQVVS